MPVKAENMTGKIFGRLTVIQRVSRPGTGPTWLCACECGGSANVLTGDLKRTDRPVRSCGCMTTEVRNKMHRDNVTHGMTKTKIYRLWQGMHNRCDGKQENSRERYHVRGIKVCERWQYFQNFYEDMGEAPPRMTLDRIDNNGNYSKENCRWATMKQQLNNRENNVRLEFKGQIKTLSEWSESLNIPYSRIWGRYKSGLSNDLILSSELLSGKRQSYQSTSLESSRRDLK